MRERIQEWAAYIGALGFALWIAAGILKILGRVQDTAFIALLVAGVLLFALYIYARPSQVRAAVTSRGARYGSNALVLTIAFVGIVGVINFLGTRYSYRWDLTAGKTNSLADQTLQVLKGLKEPVKATAFFTPNAQAGQPDIANRLKLYGEQTDKFTYQFIDPDAQPQIANDYKIQFDGTVVLERGTRRENVLTADESGLTNALLKVSQDTQPSLYFTTGHGEHSPDDTGTNGYSIVKSALETDNYK
ncbi:MAG TPA: Gldg family protein, partial [Anaerolineae bacterium]